MKILVTGATGFIGRRLLPFISSSDEIVAVCRRKPAGLPESVRVIEGDLNTPEALFEKLKGLRPDVCIHFAWEGIPDYGFEMSYRNLEQGTALFRCLVEECGCRKIIGAGSCWEYGKAFGPCREDDPVAPNLYFSWAKNALSSFGFMLAVKHGITFIWTRIFYVYGPGQRAGSLVPTIIEALKNGGPPLVKAPHNANDFVFADDVARALVLASSHDVPTGVYNLGAGKSVPVWKVCEAIETAMKTGARWSADMRGSSIKATVDFCADISKVRKELSWEPRISLEEGIEICLGSEL